MRHGSAFGRTVWLSALCVCVQCCNFWHHWSRQFISDTQVHFHSLQVKFAYQSQRITVSAASGRYRLRSTGSAAYVLPRTRTKFGERGFFYSGLAAWNTLPSDLHDITDTSTFRKWLKNVLFDRAYNWLLLALLDESYSGALQISRWVIDWLIKVKVTGGAKTTLPFQKLLIVRWFLRQRRDLSANVIGTNEL